MSAFLLVVGWFVFVVLTSVAYFFGLNRATKPEEVISIFYAPAVLAIAVITKILFIDSIWIASGIWVIAGFILGFLAGRYLSKNVEDSANGGEGQEYALVVELGEIGPIGEEKIRGINSEIADCIIARHEKYLKKVQPASTLDVGKLRMLVDTRRITQKQSQEIIVSAKRCFINTIISGKWGIDEQKLTKIQGQIWEQIGDDHFNRDEFPQAIEAFKKAIESRPDEVLYMNVGSAYASMHKYDLAIEYYEKSLEINPSYERAKRNLEMVKKYRDSH